MPPGGTKLLALLGVIFTSALALPAMASAGSADVAALQVAMSAFGLYPHPVDGITGPWTQGAVRTFQSQHGLTADGVAGPQTRAVLGPRGKPSLGDRPMHQGQKGWDIAALQFMLHTRGFESGGFDGAFGPNTADAVRRFQAVVQVQDDGVVGPTTLNVLRGGQVISAAPGGPVRFFNPVPGGVGDGFGFIPPGRWHTGLDFPEPSGTAIHAAGVGVVSFAGFNTGGYGNLVVVTHRLGYETWYAHMSSIAASVGQRVSGGVTIGYVGATGRATGPHLHFEVRHFGTPIDPTPYLLGYRMAGGSRARPPGFGKKRGRGRCRPNGDARGRKADPLSARLDRCP